MRKLLSVLFAFGVAGGVAACEQLEEFVDLADLDIPDVILSCDGGSAFDVKFTAPAPWAVDIVENGTETGWLSVSPESGAAGEITLVVRALSANESKDERSADVTITSAIVSTSFSVAQEGDPEAGDPLVDPDTKR